MAGRFSALNSQEELLEDTSLRIQQIISENKDLDYAKAITELSRESLALQALQASFTKISQLTLFNFMR
jgi:flagellar hook-associated protein 3 FlgL